MMIKMKDFVEDLSAYEIIWMIFAITFFTAIAYAVVTQL